VVAVRGQSSTIVGDGGEPERLSAYVVSPEFFEVLGEPGSRARFSGRRRRARAERVILISQTLWRRRFGMDPAILARKVNIGGFPAPSSG
jgi:putative ABC transport system permease protein